MRLAIVIAALAICAASASATTYLIRPDGTGDLPTIQAAIGAASSGDVIELADGTFTGNENRDLDFLGKAITVRSQSGNPYACTIDCQGTPAVAHRGFYFHSGETLSAVVEGIRIRNGNVTTEGMTEGYGGAIKCRDGSSVSLIDCVFSSNAGSHGGAVGVFRTSVQLTGCVFLGNNAAYGGAVALVELSTAELEDCQFNDNTASTGGAFNCSESHLEVTGSRFVGNGNSTMGGAIYAANSSLIELGDCWFEDNYCSSRGGAVCTESSSAGTASGCTFVRNYSEQHGGGIYPYGGVFTIADCTFFENLAAQSGGGIRPHDGSVVTISRTIIAFSLDGGGLRPEFGATVNLECCDIFGNLGGDWVGPIANQLGVNGNFSADPCFCDAENDDFTLWNYSPCAQVGCGTIGAWPVGCWDAQAVSDSDATGLARPDLLRVSASPSPFASTTSIRFSLPQPGGLQAEIFDLAGRVVRSLVASGLASGSTLLTWDGRDTAGKLVPAGAYWIRADQGDREAVTRVLILR